MTTNALELKAEYLPFTIVKLIDSDQISIDAQLADITRQAPNYFDGTPVVIDVTGLQQMLSAETLTYVTEALKQHKMVPAGIKGVSAKSKALVVEQGLPIINQHKTPARQTSQQESKAISHTTTKVVTKPLRSGSQVYAKNGDLIILSSVNAGAECIADGNIHIYGPLRGRALAGARGDKSARIFCHQLDAELVSIAGYFLTQEQIQVPTTNAPMTQIYWQNEQLTIESI